MGKLTIYCTYSERNDDGKRIVYKVKFEGEPDTAVAEWKAARKIYKTMNVYDIVCE